jgi:hypothetical protein
MLNRLARRLKNCTEKVKAYDFARVLQVVGVLERDAFFAQDSRFIMHSYRHSSASLDGEVVNEDFELNFRQYYDEKDTFCEEFMDMTINGKQYDLTKDVDCSQDIQLTVGMMKMLTDFLKYRDDYCNLYTKLCELERIQEELYEAEQRRKVTFVDILNTNEQPSQLFD